MIWELTQKQYVASHHPESTRSVLVIRRTIFLVPNVWSKIVLHLHEWNIVLAISQCFLLKLMCTIRKVTFLIRVTKYGMPLQRQSVNGETKLSMTQIRPKVIYGFIVNNTKMNYEPIHMLQLWILLIWPEMEKNHHGANQNWYGFSAWMPQLYQCGFPYNAVAMMYLTRGGLLITALGACWHLSMLAALYF